MNPIVIFFNKDRNVNDYSYKGTLPIGWTVNNVIEDPTEIEENFSILILADNLEAPNNLCHLNKDKDASLLIVAHGGEGSKHITPGTNKLTAGTNKILEIWGNPKIVTKFSHQKDNDTFLEIQALLSCQLSPLDFIKRWTQASNLESLTDLATLCQINILDSSADTYEQECEILREMPTEFSDEFFERDNGKRNWKKCLKLVWQMASNGI